jgi:thiamine pyrophosphokinase
VLGTTAAVVVADGDVDPSAVREALDGSPIRPYVIGADGGARRIERAGRLPDLIVGDGDSLDPDELERFGERGTAVQLHPVEKDESDTELALRAALEHGATHVRLLGALGGERVEHAIANLLLLAAGWLDGVDAGLLVGGSTIRRIGTVDGPGSTPLAGRVGDYVSLLPLDDPVQGIFTHGLRYPLDGESLPLGSTRGLSNQKLAQEAEVRSERGRLLIVETPVLVTETAGGADRRGTP